MKLYINTAKNDLIVIELKQGQKVLAKKQIKALHKQAEKLLPAINNLLKANKKTLNDFKEIVVENRGEGFTALRIGVVTANALAYALDVVLSTTSQAKVCLAQPKYSKSPSITWQKKDT